LANANSNENENQAKSSKRLKRIIEDDEE